MSDAEKVVFAIRKALKGFSVLIVGESVREGTFPVGFGKVFLRKWRLSGLRMIRVDYVIFLGEPPEKIYKQATSLLKLLQNN